MHKICAVLAVSALALASCSKKTEATGGEGKTPTNASAEKVAAEQRGKVHCPAKVETAKAPGEPVVDILGLRPGLTRAEAANLILCDNKLLVLKAPEIGGLETADPGVTKVHQGFDARFAEERKVIANAAQMDMAVRGLGNDDAELGAGQIRYHVGTAGAGPQERIYSVVREERFAEGKSPSIDSLKQALIAKYGQPSYVRDSAGDTILQWIYDPAYQKVAEPSPLTGPCRVQVEFYGSQGLSADCGPSVGVRIQPTSTNPGLAKGMVSGTVNGALANKLIDAANASATSADAARRAQEVQDAAGSTPKL